MKEGLRRVGGNLTLYKKLLTRFYRENQHFDLEVSKCYDSGDAELCLKKLHTFKGVAGNLGVTALFQKSQELEKELKNGNETGFERSLTLFTDLFNEVFSSIYQNFILKADDNNPE